MQDTTEAANKLKEIVVQNNIEINNKNKILKKWLLDNVDILLQITPHNRTSCNDEDYYDNGNASNGHAPRCTRCALLLIRHENFNYDIIPDISLSLAPILPQEIQRIKIDIK